MFCETLVNFSMLGYGLADTGLPGFDTNRVCFHRESLCNPALQAFQRGLSPSSDRHVFMSTHERNLLALQIVEDVFEIFFQLLPSGTVQDH